MLKNGALAAVTNGLGLLPAGSAGGRARPSKAPEMPLELWSYEASPFCKIVREQLRCAAECGCQVRCTAI